MNPSRIRTMDELQQQQDKLQHQMVLTKHELLRSADNTSQLGKDFLLKKVLLPAGAFGLGFYAVKKIMHHKSASSTGHENGQIVQEEVIQEKGSHHWFSKIMLVALPLIQQFFLRKETHEKVEDTALSAKGQSTRLYEEEPSPVMSILSKVIPMAIPILQQYFAKQAQGDSGYVVEKKLSEDGEYYEDVKVKKNNPSPFNWLYQLMPVVLPLLQQHFLNQKVDEKKEESSSYAGKYETASSY